MLDIQNQESDRFMVSLCTVPVEGAGTELTRLRSEGGLGIVPKIAIVSLIKWMELHGYKKENWDFYDIDMLYSSDDTLRTYFRTLQPNVVGLSAVVSTSFSQVKYISRLVREECPDCWIVMGGHLTASSDVVLRETDVELTIVGDGEIAWVQFLDYAKKFGRRKNYDELKRIPGICLLNQDGTLFFEKYGPPIKQEEMPLVDYEILKDGLKMEPGAIANYFRPALESGWFDLDPRAHEPDRAPNVAGVYSSKGCVAKCTFCQRATKGYRVQPYEDLDSHLKLLRSQYDVGFIQVLDENFGSNKKHTYELAKVLRANDMLWMATGVRCTSVTEEDIVFYKDHGCCAFKFGVESGSQKILDLMEKNFTVADVHRAIDLCIKHGIYSPMSVMVGMPGDDLECAAQTGEMIGRIAARIGVHPEALGYDILYALPLPGTPLYEYGELKGVIPTDSSGAAEYLLRTVNAGIYKRNYVNLNGAHVSEVIFWDIYIKMEASRAYRKHVKNSVIVNPDFQRVYVEMREKELRKSTRFHLKYTALEFTYISWFLDNYIVGNRIADALPRFLVYPVVYLLNWFEFVMQLRFKRNMANNLFAMSGKGVERLNFDLVAGQKSSRARSLRGIVKELKGKSPRMETNYLSGPRQLLNMGL